MVILKKIGRVALSVLAGALALVLLVCIIFNSLKFAIYYDYYSMKSNLCDNPGLNDGFVCQGIAAVDGRDLILVSGYMTGIVALYAEMVITLDGKFGASVSGFKKALGQSDAGRDAGSVHFLYRKAGIFLYICPLGSICQAESRKQNH